MERSISRVNIVIAFILITYLKPMNATLIGPLDNIYKILKVIATFLLIWIALEETVWYSLSTWLCMVWLAIWTLSIYLNVGSFSGVLQEIMSIIGIAFAINLVKASPRRIEFFFHCLACIAKIYIVLDLITVFMDKPLFVEAVVSYDKYFLGSDNYSAFILIPLCGFIFVDSYIRNGKMTISAGIFSILGFLCLAFPKAMTGMAAYALYLLLMCMVNYPQIRKIFKIKYILIFSAMFLIGVIFFDIDDFFAVVLKLIGKEGLNSRNVIWDRTIEAFLQKPVLGWGMLTEQQKNSTLLYGAGHAHNLILEFMLDTGVSGCFLIIGFLYSIFRSMYKCRAYYMYTIQMCLACYFLCAIFDFYIGLIYFWLMMFAIETCKTYYYKRREG